MGEKRRDAPDLLLIAIDSAFSGRGWQGPTLCGSVRGVTLETALFRPQSHRKCIWDHVLHAAYWKYSVTRALGSRSAARFERVGANWPALPVDPTPAAWTRDIALLKQSHSRLRKAVAAIEPDRLMSRERGRKWRLADYVLGIAAHDAYHTGQIQLLKRLSKAG